MAGRLRTCPVRLNLLLQFFDGISKAFVSSCDGMSRNAAEASLKTWTQGFR